MKLSASSLNMKNFSFFGAGNFFLRPLKYDLCFAQGSSDRSSQNSQLELIKFVSVS